MYYRWKPEWRYRRNKSLDAKLRPFMDRWSEIKRWSCSPLEVAIPLLEYTFDGRAPLTDVLFSVSDWTPYSSRLRAGLRQLGVRFEEFPCVIRDARSGGLLSDDYAVVHLLECHPCMDLQRSVYESKVPETGKVGIGQISRIVPTQECLDAAYPLFRVKEALEMVLAHEKTRQWCLQEGITGVQFLPIDDIPVMRREPPSSVMAKAAPGAPMPTLGTHEKDVRSVAFSPDGQLLASGSDEPIVKLWETGTRSLARTVGPHKSSVHGLAFSPDGRVLAAADSFARMVRLWDVTTGEHLHAFSHRAGVDSVAFSADGTLLAVGSPNAVLTVWEVASRREVRTITKAHRTRMVAMALSPDGHLLASGATDDTAKVWEVATGQPVVTVQYVSWVVGVAFSPDGRLLAIGGHNGAIKLLQVPGWEEVRAVKHPNRVTGVAFSADGRFLTAGAIEGTVAVWEVATGDEVKLFACGSCVKSVALSPGGDLLAAGCIDGSVRLAELRSGV